MKKHLVAVMVAMFALVASAELISLSKGLNAPGVSGRIVAVDALTEVANQAITIKAVKSLGIETNAVRQFVTDRVRYSFTLTNWYGVASVATNVWDRFDPIDFRPDNTNHIVGAVAEVWIPVTNQVVVGRALKETVVVTNDVWSGTASDHLKLDTPEGKFLTGDPILVTCGESDTVKLIVE